MLTDKELLSLLREGESECVEFTVSKADTDKFCKAICAFANDLSGNGKPGVLFIGVNDKGEPTGQLTVDDNLLQMLAGLRNNKKILPLPAMVAQKRRLKSADVAVVIVEPVVDPPVRYDGRCWIRVGSSAAIASPNDEIRLNEKRVAADLTFDQRSARPSAGLNDLNPYAFQDYLTKAVSEETLEDNNRDTSHQLQSLGFMNTAGNVNNAGILCFGKKPDDWFGGAYIQFLRCPGTDIVSAAEAITHRQIRGGIFQQIRDIESLMGVHIQTPAIIGSPRRVDFPAYPEVALQQTIRNAVLHRSYEGTNAPIQFYWFSDRVEISSPGGPYGRVNAANFGQAGITDYRNRKLAEAMRAMEFIERFGFGLGAIRRSMERNGNPEPEFRVGETNVTVVLRKLDLDALIAKAAELVCCQALFRFKRDCDSKPPGKFYLYIPGVSRVGDSPGFVIWGKSSVESEIREPGFSIRMHGAEARTHDEIKDKIAMTIALRMVKEYTLRRKVGPPFIRVAGERMDKMPPPSPPTPLVRMARIMYVLCALFGADERKIQEELKESLEAFPWEVNARKEDDAEFRRLMDARPPLEEIEADINREADDNRIQALLIHG